jgi:hypothetical protein
VLGSSFWPKRKNERFYPAQAVNIAKLKASLEKSLNERDEKQARAVKRNPNAICASKQHNCFLDIPKIGCS